MNAMTERKGLDWFSEASMAAGRGSDVMLGDLTANKPSVSELQASGERLVYMSLVLLRARAALPVDTWPGFYVGVAAMHYVNVRTNQLIAMREELTPAARKGFDMALSLYIGYARKAQFGCVPVTAFAGGASFGAEAKTILGMPAGKSKPRPKMALARLPKIVRPAVKAPASGPADAAAQFLQNYGKPSPTTSAPDAAPKVSEAVKAAVTASLAAKKDASFVAPASPETGIPPTPEPPADMIAPPPEPAPVESTAEAPKTYLPATFVESVSKQDGIPAETVEVEPGKLAGYLATSGLPGATEAQRVSLMKEIATTPEVRQGAVVAIKEEAKKRDESIFTKILRFFGLA